MTYGYGFSMMSYEIEMILPLKGKGEAIVQTIVDPFYSYMDDSISIPLPSSRPLAANRLYGNKFYATDTAHGTFSYQGIRFYVSTENLGTPPQ